MVCFNSNRRLNHNTTIKNECQLSQSWLVSVGVAYVWEGALAWVLKVLNRLSYARSIHYSYASLNLGTIESYAESNAHATTTSVGAGESPSGPIGYGFALPSALSALDRKV